MLDNKNDGQGYGSAIDRVPYIYETPDLDPDTRKQTENKTYPLKSTSTLLFSHKYPLSYGE